MQVSCPDNRSGSIWDSGKRSSWLNHRQRINDTILISYSQVKKDCCTIFNMLHEHSVMEWYFGALAGFQTAKEGQTRRRGRKPKDRISETISAFKTATEYATRMLQVQKFHTSQFYISFRTEYVLRTQSISHCTRRVMTTCRKL